MPVLTIRDLDEPATTTLRARAAQHGRSVEDEARDILTAALRQPGWPESLADSIRKRVAPLGGMDIPPVERGAMRQEPPLSD